MLSTFQRVGAIMPTPRTDLTGLLGPREMPGECGCGVTWRISGDQKHFCVRVRGPLYEPQQLIVVELVCVLRDDKATQRQSARTTLN